jgi:LCP family protein required for cell wall assembly
MSSGRIHRAPLLLVGLIIVLVGVGGGAGVYFAADRREAGVQRVDVASALSNKDANTGPAENYLIVGSDSRANFDPEGSGQGGCQCSDTLMVLRRDPDDGASLLSIPRDLWVEIPGHGEGKINSAYSHGPEVVIDTVEQSLGIPINHYIEIDFAGFKTLVDAIGGVEVCVPYLARDDNTGMELQPGCQTVDGEGALSYARSRHYREFIDGQWVEDNKNDFGRIERQQAFVRSAVDALLQEVVANPERLGDLIDVAGNAITFDEDANLFDTGEALAAAAGEGLQTFTVPSERFLVDGQDALSMLPEAEPLLDYFRGVGPMPVDTAASTEPSDTSG